MKVDEIKLKIKELLDAGEFIYYVNVHGVGTEYRIKGLSVEEVIGNQHNISCPNQTYKEDQKTPKKDIIEIFNYMENLFEEQTKKHGYKSKDRGLY